MALITQSGGEVLHKLFTDFQDPASGWPLFTHLSFGSIPTENWDTASYNPDSENTKLNFKSFEDSKLNIIGSNSGNDSAGGNAL